MHSSAPARPSTSPLREMFTLIGAVASYLLMLLWWLVAGVAPAMLLGCALAGSAHALIVSGPSESPDPPGATLQWVVGAMAVGNFALSLATWYSARHKAATARLEAVEHEMRTTFSTHAERLAGLMASNETAITHEHLAEVYGDIKQIAAQINTLAGQTQQMNDSLRLLLARMVQA